MKNRFNKCPSNENSSLYRKQRNYCTNLLAREKKNYLNNLDLRIFKDNKTFWQRVKPLFSDKKCALKRNITIVEDNVIYTKEEDVAEKLNNFFIDAVGNLEIESFATLNAKDVASENILEIVKMYELDPSVLKIIENVEIAEKFNFKNISSNQMMDEINKLNPKKSCIGNDIPTKILIGNVTSYVNQYLTLQ